MEKGKVFCEECREFVEYIVVEEEAERTLMGKPYSIMEITAYCVKCNSEVYVWQFNDENLDRLYKVFREENNKNNS